MQQEKKKDDSCRFEPFDANRTGPQTSFHRYTFQTLREWERTNIGAPYTDFDYNHYKHPTTERSSKVAELRDAMKLTREID